METKRYGTVDVDWEWEQFEPVAEEQAEDIYEEQADIVIFDPRRCPRHPNVQTSSDDGMFDAPCGECEYESDSWAERYEWERPDRPIARCGLGYRYWGYDPKGELVSCLATLNDELVF